MANEQPFITMYRVLEYYGPKDWVQKTMQMGQVPPTGIREFPGGMAIRSGVVQWVSEGQPSVSNTEPPVPPIATLPPGGRPS
jgi:hypothetical protein